MLIASGELDRTTSAWFFIIGLVLLWAGVSSRLARRELRNAELAALNYPIKVAAFWGHDAKAERQAYFDKFEEHKNWRNNLRFELTNWTIIGIGAALCLLGLVLSLGDDQSHTWDRVWDIVGPFVIAVVGIYYVYQLMKRLDKAESEFRWLSFMLKQVKDNGQVNYSELERRARQAERKVKSNLPMGCYQPRHLALFNRASNLLCEHNLRPGLGLERGRQPLSHYFSKSLVKVAGLGPVQATRLNARPLPQPQDC